MTTKTTNSRDETIKTIRKSLRERSGKTWSVKGGRGTSWGWIKIEAPPARCTWRHKLLEGKPDWPENYRPVDTGQPGRMMSPADQAELAELLGVSLSFASGGIKIPAQGNYYQEYIDRAAGLEPSVIGTPYWD